MRIYVFAFLCLSACGGGGGGFVEDDPMEDLPTFIEPETNLGPSGTATYEGPMSLSFTPSLASPVNLAGTLGLTVNFDATTDAVTGDASGFETSAGGQVDGRLFLSGGALDDSGSGLVMDSQISGSLRSGADSYLIFGQLNGEFQENDHSAIVGSVSGTVRQAGIDSNLSGGFLGIRLP